MSRPPRQISNAVLNSLDKRLRLRYTLTSKGAQAHERGETDYEAELESLIEAIQANNKQPVSLVTWRKFHAPKKLTNTPLKDLVQGQIIRLVSRGKFTMAVEE